MNISNQTGDNKHFGIILGLMDTLRDMMKLPFTALGYVAVIIERFLFIMIRWYDNYVYSPLQTVLSPLVARVPRAIHYNNKSYTIFTANIVSWTRTLLVIPIGWCLKYEYHVTAFLLVLFHDFLDHLDGIVAKVQKQIYGPVDDPLLGGFMDAFCDKIVNVTALWTILMVTPFSAMSTQGSVWYLIPCVVIIGYEFVLGVVRVQDYFGAYYARKHKNQEKEGHTNTAAVMEGKLKEKLESMGIAFLCLAQSNNNPTESISGISGIVCLLLSVRLAHASLQHKLKARRHHQTKTVKLHMGTVDYHDDKDYSNEPLYNNDGSLKKQKKEENSTATEEAKHHDQNTLVEDDDEIKKDETTEKELDHENRKRSDSSDSENEKMPKKLVRSHSVPMNDFDGRVDKVYTIGCFDLFHKGHIRLLQRMRALGKQVIVGVHDSRSIFKLKKRVPIDSTEKRMLNVKQYADIVYVIAGTNPSVFLASIVDVNEDKTCLYVRGDDMYNFPSRELCERLMPVTFLPYTAEVSSTKLRKEMYNSSKFGPHVHAEDDAMFY